MAVEATAPRPEIFLADDDDALREMLAEGLQTLDVTVKECADGQELKDELAAAAARGQLPSLVISDQRMPRLSGLEVLAWIRRTGLEVPFVLMSAFAPELLRESGERHGATRVFDKPVDLREIRGFVAELLELGARVTPSGPGRDPVEPA